MLRSTAQPTEISNRGLDEYSRRSKGTCKKGFRIDFGDFRQCETHVVVHFGALETPGIRQARNEREDPSLRHPRELPGFVRDVAYREMPEPNSE